LISNLLSDGDGLGTKLQVLLGNTKRDGREKGKGLDDVHATWHRSGNHV
jgi:hypothetical protein